MLINETSVTVSVEILQDELLSYKVNSVAFVTSTTIYGKLLLNEHDKINGNIHIQEFSKSFTRIKDRTNYDCILVFFF